MILPWCYILDNCKQRAKNHLHLGICYPQKAFMLRMIEPRLPHNGGWTYAHTHREPHTYVDISKVL